MSKVDKPWGYFEVLLDEKRFKVKKLLIKSRESISYQYHKKRSEIWFVKQGTGFFTLNLDARQVVSGDILFVGVEDKHKITNMGTDDLIIYELQYGESCEEDDIVRISDNYGRT